MENNPLSRVVVDIITFINVYLVPLAFAAAFILFLFGVFKYFFALGKDAGEKREEGKKFVMWGIVALAVMFAVWGLVNILLRTFGLENQARPCIPTFSGPCSTGVPGRTGGGNSPLNTTRDLNGTAFGNDPSVLNAPGQPSGL
ncbi:MAG TPA: pilin [Candidatus Paceibacterota bacterium]|jgi:hypothetical protein